MTSAGSPETLAAAERAYALVQAEPRRALNLAENAVSLARRRRDVEGLAAALHVLGYARSRVGDPRALRTMRAAVATAERHGLHRRAALARRNLALHLAYRGQLRRAVGEIDAAVAALAGVDRARSEVFRIAVYHLAGRSREGLRGSARALRVLRDRGDAEWEARLAYNRGAALSELGDYRLARRDLERAHKLYVQQGLTAAAADASKELALLAGLQGDSIRSLAELDAIDIESLTERAACWLHLSRAETLLALRLLPEAQEELERFSELSFAQRSLDSLNKARLDAARLMLAAGDAPAAEVLAQATRRSFAARGQRSFAAAAAFVSLAAKLSMGPVSDGRLRSAARAADELEQEGWTLETLRAHVLLARARALNGAGAAARRELAAARPLEHVGSIADRIELLHARALVSIQAEDRAAADRYLRRGLTLLEAHRAAFGAIELRATTSALGVELARDGLRLAIDGGMPRRALDWAERLRANALRLPAIRPPADPKLRSAQTELRALERKLLEQDGRSRSARALRARRSTLEAVVRSRSRLVRGRAGAAAVRLDLNAVSEVLGDRTLVEYVELDGSVFAFTLRRGRLALHSLGVSRYREELEWLHFGLRRVVRESSDSRALAAVASSAAALDGQLVAPLADALGEGPVVIVPTGSLHALPWAALPSLKARPIVAAPSLAVWLELAARPRPTRRRRVFVAGPRLRHATGEVRALAALGPSASVLCGKDATVSDTLAALDGAGLAHVACHGHFRADSPLFSSLELTDGRLTALDLQRLRQVPDIFILSSCDLALSERHPGDELLGLSAALLGLGTRTIVASVVPVPDAASRRLMLAFHRSLADGRTPSAALADAQAVLRRDATSLAGFVCLGSG